MWRIQYVFLSLALTAGHAAWADSKTATAPTVTMKQVANVRVDGPNFDSAYTLTATNSGSRPNGPALAHVGMKMNCYKENWWTSTAVGETDCMSIELRQSGPASDGSGILINAENTGTGFLSATEFSSAYVDTKSNSIKMGVDIQEGVINWGATMYGAAYNAYAGRGYDALRVYASGNGSWQNVLEAVDAASHLYYSVDGQGNTSQDGDARIKGALYVHGVLQASSTPVKALSASRMLAAADCGTTMRVMSDKDIALSIGSDIPVGCRVGVIQAGKGSVRFTSIALKVEHLGEDAEQMTIGQYAQAEIFRDSASSYLVSGQTHGSRPSRALASLSSHRVLDVPSLMLASD